MAPQGQIAQRVAAAWAATLFFCAAALCAEPARLKQATGSVIRSKGKIQTGSSSRVELELPYLATVRVGSNASFQFSADYRTLALDKGTMLLAAPKDAGAFTVRAGGVVTQTAAGRAAALELSNVAGQVKVIALDGKMVSQLAAAPGQRANLRAGQMVNIPAGATSMPAATAFKLAALLKTSMLFNMGSFPGQRAIRQNATKQSGAPVLPPFVTGGFDPDWGGGANALTTLGPAGTAAGVSQMEANAQGQRVAELTAQQAVQQAATQQAAIAQQQQAQQALLERNRQQAAQALALAAAVRAAQQAAAERQAQQQAAQQAAQQQGNQGNAFGPGGNPNNPNQGNQGGGSGKPPNVPPGQVKPRPGQLPSGGNGRPGLRPPIAPP